MQTLQDFVMTAIQTINSKPPKVIKCLVMHMTEEISEQPGLTDEQAARNALAWFESQMRAIKSAGAQSTESEYAEHLFETFRKDEVWGRIIQEETDGILSHNRY